MPETRQVQGLITIVQESRFRLQDAEGRGYLFVLCSNLDPTDLQRLQRARTPVIVTYTGQPDVGAVALNVRPAGGIPLH